MYAQAFGAILGLIACLYEYIYGNLVVIGNRFVPGMDYINFICGYALYPLCIIVFFISLINLILNKKPNQLKNVALLNKIFDGFLRRKLCVLIKKDDCLPPLIRPQRIDI